MNKECTSFKTESQNQHQAQVDLQNKINSKDKEIDELANLLNKMKLDTQANTE